MHVGVDASRAALPQPTGTETYAREIIAGLVRIDPSIQLTLYVNRWLDTDWRPPPGAGVRELPWPRLWTHARLSLEMAQAPPDVLFVPAHVLPLWHPRANVVTVHDLGYRHFPSDHPRLSRWYRVWSTRFSVRGASRIIAVSEATRRDLIELEGVAAERIRVVHHGVDPALEPVKDSAQQAAVRAHYGLPERYFLFLGTVQPRKNLARLIEAYQRLAIASADLPALALAGEVGWLAEPILRQANQPALCERVRLLGYVPRQDLAPLLSGCLAFVFPSLYEGFGMPVLEAMACGAPVLASNTSSLPEVAGEAALLVDPLDVGALADGLKRLAQDAALREELAAHGIVRASHFSWDRAARETLAVLREAVNDRQSASGR